MSQQIEKLTREAAFATYFRHKTGFTGGTTADTYGTAVEENFPTWAKHVIGLLIIGVLPTYTAAEGKSNKIKMAIKSAGVVDEEFQTGPYQTSGPASHNSGLMSVAELIPLDIKLNGGEAVKLSAAPLGTSTAGLLYEASWLLTNDLNKLPKNFLQALMMKSCLPFRAGQSVGKEWLTVVREDLTAIKAEPREAIVGVKCSIIKNGAITAAQEGLGTFDLETALVPEFEVPTMIGSAATLGTPTGIGASVPHVPYFPCYVPKSGKEETLTPYVTLKSAVSTSNRADFALAWR